MRRKLDQKTQDALRKLDAVESVTETRIQYSEGFRKTALERDRRRDSTRPSSDTSASNGA